MMIFSWLLLVLYRRSVTPWADHWFHYKARAVLGTHHHSTSVFFGSIGMLWRPQLVLFWCSVFVIWIAEGWSHQMYYWHLFGCCGSLYFYFYFQFVCRIRPATLQQANPVCKKNVVLDHSPWRRLTILDDPDHLQEEVDLSGWFQLFTKNKWSYQILKNAFKFMALPSAVQNT